jgi:enamine deaminase RidA (YjgF/YER057c/UK114 family)
MRRTYKTGGFEDVGGYSRAVRSGPWIAVSGTAATGADGQAMHPGDVSQQTRHSFEVALDALANLGGRVEDVLRTRIYLAPDSDWRAAVEVHHALFGDTRPANTTLFVAGFPPPGVLVEVEVDAVVASGDS